MLARRKTDASLSLFDGIDNGPCDRRASMPLKSYADSDVLPLPLTGGGLNRRKPYRNSGCRDRI